MTGVRDLDHHGVKWMGDTSSNWPIHPVKHYYEVQLGRMLQNQPSNPNDRLVPYIKALHVGWGCVSTDDLPEMWAGISDVRQYGILGGDLLICEGGEVGRAGVVASPPPNCVIQNSVHRVRPKDSADVRFLQHVLKAVNAAGWFDVLCNRATIAHFTREKLADLRIPIPPLEEQRAIASFLDHEMARIDALTARKQHQIELLQEKREALICEAVTKGINPKAGLKDSRCPGWGAVPAHWTITRLMHLTPPDRQIMYGIVLPGPDFEGGIPIVKGGNCEPGRLRLDMMSRTTPEIEAGYVRSRLKAGDIVYAIRGSIGAADIVPPELEGANLTQDAARISPRPGVCNRWLLYTLQSAPFFSRLDSQATGATIRGINIFDLRRAHVVAPPLDEQKAIAIYLDDSCGRINALISRVAKSIDMLTEFRAALISAAVMGKIDIREEVPA